ncbi:MAG: hypothetical protein OZ923_11235 [Comamonadaceae bacterium]|nr:hypothetical protein [Comamonadaceae bacterium]
MNSFIRNPALQTQRACVSAPAMPLHGVHTTCRLDRPARDRGAARRRQSVPCNCANASQRPRARLRVAEFDFVKKHDARHGTGVACSAAD